MGSQENSQIDSVIEYLQQNYLHAENEFTEQVYREVIHGFLCESGDIQEAASKTFGVYDLVHTYRFTLAREITRYPEFDWDDRKKRAVEYLDKASELLDDPLSGTDFYKVSKYLAAPDKCQLFKDKGLSMPGRINNKDDIEKLAELDILAIVISRISLALEDTPTEKIIPYHARNPLYKRQGYLPEDVGKRGSKSNQSIFYRRLDRAISDHTKNRDSVISKLTNMAIYNHRKKDHSLFVPDVPDKPKPLKVQIDKLLEDSKDAAEIYHSDSLTIEEKAEYFKSLIDLSKPPKDHIKGTHRNVAIALKAKQEKKLSGNEKLINKILKRKLVK